MTAASFYLPVLGRFAWRDQATGMSLPLRFRRPAAAVPQLSPLLRKHGLDVAFAVHEAPQLPGANAHSATLRHRVSLNPHSTGAVRAV